jgi:glycosyltransferase involved in cell wall biosynthesis
MTDTKAQKPLRVIAVGPLPPPPGGVASSLQSLVDATRGRDDITLNVIPWKQMWKVILRRPDALHLHFSKPFKRFLGVIVARLSGAKVVHTIHSNNFDFDRLGNRLACLASDGFILLNSEIQERFRARRVRNCILMTPILARNMKTGSTKLEPRLDNWLKQSPARVAVVYSHDRREVKGCDIYGFSFITSLLPELDKMGWRVVFLDPYANYASGELFGSDYKNAILQSSNVDFEELLLRTDLYLRPTATDGNSIAVLEALTMGIPVIASDVVPRAPGVILHRFLDASDFLEKVELAPAAGKDVLAPNLNTPEEYICFLRSTGSRNVPC